MTSRFLSLAYRTGMFGWMLLALLVHPLSAQTTELRGVWMTPREGPRLWTRTEIGVAMRQVADANFNTVYFNAWSRGWPLWRSRMFEREFGFSTDPAAGERDILAEAIEVAHAAGLNIEAWMEYGFVGWWSGNEIDSLPLGPMFRKYPAWLAGTAGASEELESGHVGTFYWMAHSRPDVQSFLADLHAEVAADYDADGIELDRVRYPKLDCGYDSATVALYASSRGGAQPPGNPRDTSWMRWRADRLNEFHRLAFRRIKEANPRIVVSNASGRDNTGDGYSAYEEFLQDWRQWLRDGSVEIVQVPMYAGPDELRGFPLSALATLPDSLKKRTSAGLVVDPGGRSISEQGIVQLVRIARSVGIAGHSVWFYNDLRDRGLFSVLKRDVYQQPAAVPVRRSDVVQKRQVAPGVAHYSYTLEGPYTLDVLAVDLREPTLSVETFRPESLSTTTEQVRRRSVKGGTALGAVNADFFSFRTHWPVGNQVSKGIMVVGLPSKRSHVAFSVNGRPVMEPVTFSGTVSMGPSSVSVLLGVNTPSDSSGPVLYNSYWGSSTRTPQGTWEAQLRPLQAWMVNATVRCVVEKVDRKGNSSLSGDRAVLSWQGGGKMAALKNDDTVTVVFTMGSTAWPLKEVIGGGGRILVEGRTAPDSLVVLESVGRKFATDRHPRTFVAIDRDSSTLFLCTVDGRQTSSIGMNFREMARFLRSIGGWNAINLDGGGSTTMVVEGGIVNSPSDRTGERAVANTLMVVRR